MGGVGTTGGNQAGGMGYLMDQVLTGIPTPNKLNSTEFFRSAPSAQNFALQGLQEMYGLDPQDALAI